MRRLIIRICFVLAILTGVYELSQHNKTHAYDDLEEIRYNLFDNILVDTIGYYDGIYKFNNDDDQIVFICTTKEEIMEINKYIFVFNKKTKKFSVESLKYLVWGTIIYDEKYNKLVDRLTSDLAEFKDVSLTKVNNRFLKKVKNYNKYCDFAVERVKENLNNKDNNND